MILSPPQFAAAIRTERAAIEALVAVLAEERDALSGGHTDSLAAIAPRKRELLLHVAHLGEQRNRSLEHSGLTADRTGMERWLIINDAAGSVRAEWRALLEQTQAAQDLNRSNGIFIDAGMRANQQALQTLMSAGATASTYGPAGRSLNPLASRSLASA